MITQNKVEIIKNVINVVARKDSQFPDSELMLLDRELYENIIIPNINDTLLHMKHSTESTNCYRTEMVEFIFKGSNGNDNYEIGYRIRKIIVYCFKGEKGSTLKALLKGQITNLNFVKELSAVYDKYKGETSQNNIGYCCISVEILLLNDISEPQLLCDSDFNIYNIDEINFIHGTEAEMLKKIKLNMIIWILEMNLNI